MKLGLVEELGVEAGLVSQPDGRVCLGIYCAQCKGGIALIVLAEKDTDPRFEYDWPSDSDVHLAIDTHYRQHPGIRAQRNGH